MVRLERQILCIACNRYIKFEGLLDRALKLGAEYVATGHYAKIIKDSETGRYLLKKAQMPIKINLMYYIISIKIR